MCIRDSTDTGENTNFGESARAAVDAIVRLLHPGEDTVVQHYACKAIDNVLAKRGFWPEQFATPGIAHGLLKVRYLPLAEPHAKRFVVL